MDHQSKRARLERPRPGPQLLRPVGSGPTPATTALGRRASGAVSPSPSSSSASSSASVPPPVNVTIAQRHVLLLATPKALLDKFDTAVNAKDVEEQAALVSSMLAYLQDPKIHQWWHSVALTIVLAAKRHPSVFKTPKIVRMLLGQLSRKSCSTAKLRDNQALPIVACNLLMVGHAGEDVWPSSFILPFVLDSLGERYWVDHEETQLFVENLKTMFGVMPSQLPTSNVNRATSSGDGHEKEPVIDSLSDKQDVMELDTGDIKTTTNNDDPILVESDDSEGWIEMTIVSDKPDGSSGMSGMSVKERFPKVNIGDAEQALVKYAKEQIKPGSLGARSSSSNTKNVIKTLSGALNLQSVRVLVSRELQGWLQLVAENGLVLNIIESLGVYCQNNTKEDREVLISLLRLKLPSKSKVPLLQPLTSTIEAIMKNNTVFPIVVVQHLVQAEVVSPMHSLPVDKQHPLRHVAFDLVFKVGGAHVSKIFGCLIQDHLADPRDAKSREIKAALRATVKKNAQNSQFDLQEFSMGLLTIRLSEEKFKSLPQHGRERLVYGIAELFSLTCFSSCNQHHAQQFKQEFETNPDPVTRRYSEDILTFKKSFSMLQHRAVDWLSIQVPQYLGSEKSPAALVKQILSLFLFIAGPEPLLGAKEENLNELDRQRFRMIYNDIVIANGTITTIIRMGLNHQHPLQPQDAISTVHDIVRRAVSLCHYGKDAPRIGQDVDAKIMEDLLSLTAYSPTIKLPRGYQAPSMAVTQSYWQVWVALTILAACNPQTVGKIGWRNYPTMRVLMTMCITGGDQELGIENVERERERGNGKVETKKSKNASAQISVSHYEEKMAGEKEQSDILGFEAHLARAYNQQIPTIGTSKLLGGVCTHDPKGLSRIIPAKVVEELRRTNSSVRLGTLLCASREPDFLLDMMNKNGADASLEWLGPLIELIPGIVAVLPTQILCELALRTSGNKENGENASKILQERVKNGGKDLSVAVASLFPALSSPVATKRDIAFDVCSTAFTSRTHTKGGTWLSEAIVAMPGYSNLSSTVIKHLLKAMTVTTQTKCLYQYGEFVVQNTPSSMNYEVVKSLGSIICKRQCARKYLLNSEVVVDGVSKLFLKVIQNGGAPGAPVSGISTSMIYLSANGEGNERDRKCTVEWNTVKGILYAVGSIGTKISGSGIKKVVEFLTYNTHNIRVVVECVMASRDLFKLLLQCPFARLILASVKDVSIDEALQLLAGFGLSLTAVSVLTGQVAKLIVTGPPRKKFSQRDLSRIENRLSQLRVAGISISGALEGWMKETTSATASHAADPIKCDAEVLNQNDVMDVDVPVVESKDPIDAELEKIVLTDDTASESSILAKLRAVLRSSRSQSMDQNSMDIQESCHEVQSFCNFIVRTIDSENADIREHLTKSLEKRTPFWCTSLGLLATYRAGQNGSEAIDSLTAVLLQLPLPDAVKSALLAFKLPKKLSSAKLTLSDFAIGCRESSMSYFVAALSDSAKYTRLHDLTLTDFKHNIQNCASTAIAHFTSNLGFEDFMYYVISAILFNSDATDRIVGLKAVVNALFVFMIANVNRRGIDSFSFSTGLLLDWLQLLDPEMIYIPRLGSTRENRQNYANEAVLLQMRCILSSFLEHCSWNELLSHLNDVLDSHNHLDRHEVDGANVQASSEESQITLDFTMCCIRLRRTWCGGRPVGKGDSALTLTPESAHSFIQLLLLSLAQYGHVQQESTLAMSVLQDRVALLVSFIKSKEGLKAAIEVVKNYQISGTISSSGGNRQIQTVALMLEAQLYMLCPGRIDHNARTMTKEAMSLGSVLDHVLQRTIISLLTVERDIAVNESSVDQAFVLLRKLALTHPIPTLKTVPTISAMMMSELSNEIDIVLDRGYHMVCYRVAVIWHSLKPFIYSHEAHGILQTCVSPSIRLFSMYQEDSDGRLFGAISSLIQFWSDFAVSSWSVAQRMLRDHADVMVPFLRDFIRNGSDKFGPGSSSGNSAIILEQCISLQSPSNISACTNVTLSVGSIKSIRVSALNTIRSHDVGASHFLEITRQMQQAADDNVATLEYFVDNLLEMIHIPDIRVCEAAYSLLSQLLDSPSCTAGSRCAELACGSVIQALLSPSIVVVNEAFKHAIAIYMASGSSNGSTLLQTMVHSSGRSNRAHMEIQKLIKTVLPAA